MHDVVSHVLRLRLGSEDTQGRGRHRRHSRLHRRVHQSHPSGDHRIVHEELHVFEHGRVSDRTASARLMKRREPTQDEATASRRRGSRRQRGAVMVEAVIAFPLLIVLMMGCLEFGMAWRDSTSVSTALRASARTAASQGNDDTADYYALQALKAGLNGIST